MPRSTSSFSISTTEVDFFIPQNLTKSLALIFTVEHTGGVMAAALTNNWVSRAFLLKNSYAKLLFIEVT